MTDARILEAQVLTRAIELRDREHPELAGLFHPGKITAEHRSFVERAVRELAGDAEHAIVDQNGRIAVTIYGDEDKATAQARADVPRKDYMVGGQTGTQPKAPASDRWPERDEVEGRAANEPPEPPDPPEPRERARPKAKPRKSHRR